MRRKDKEILDQAEILAVIAKSTVCRLALCDKDQPYIIPMCFGLDGQCLYFHCAREGRKLDMINSNPNVCFEFDIDTEIVPGTGCDIGMRYRSVIGFGKASIVESDEERMRALDVIISHYDGKAAYYPSAVVAKTAIFRVDIESMTGKKSGY
jgi:uncharacterized protein